jgi:hypothetical protein
LRHVGRYAERVDEWPDRGRRAASLREGKRIGYMSVVE